MHSYNLEIKSSTLLKINHDRSLGFVQRMLEWFIKISSNEIYYVNRLREKNKCDSLSGRKAFLNVRFSKWPSKGVQV